MNVSTDIELIGLSPTNSPVIARNPSAMNMAIPRPMPAPSHGPSVEETVNKLFIHKDTEGWSHFSHTLMAAFRTNLENISKLRYIFGKSIQM
jgi:hypothetical protein